MPACRITSERFPEQSKTFERPPGARDRAPLDGPPERGLGDSPSACPTWGTRSSDSACAGPRRRCIRPGVPGGAGRPGGPAGRPEDLATSKGPSHRPSPSCCTRTSSPSIPSTRIAPRACGPSACPTWVGRASPRSWPGSGPIHRGRSSAKRSCAPWSRSSRQTVRGRGTRGKSRGTEAMWQGQEREAAGHSRGERHIDRVRSPSDDSRRRPYERTGRFRWPSCGR